MLTLVVLVALALAHLYVRRNDRRLRATPSSVLSVSAHRWTDEEIKSVYARMQSRPIDVHAVLPPRTGRKYIVVGGAGFLGGWIVVHLLKRGEDPRRIRVLDIRMPTRKDLTTGIAALVDFRTCDISDEGAVHAAFSAPWPTDGDNNDEKEEITVFHTAATIRFYERLFSLVPLSAAVNVRGMRHIIDASRAIGASILITTSSGSIALRRSRFWLWPWEHQPPYFVQCIDDDERKVPERHGEFFSNYAYTKRLGEALVRGADGAPASGGKVLRTGCVRPGNGVYGPGGDVLLGAALVREVNPTWISTSVHNFVYVENASLAHLCYEARLIEPKSGKDVGGQAYCIADAGPPPSYGSVYHVLALLTNNRTTFPELSPTLMLFLAHIIEVVYLTRYFLISSLLSLPLSSSVCAAFKHIIPTLPEELLNLQPSLFALVCVHMLFDDSRARREIGYAPQWTTLEGVCALVDAFEKNGRVAEARQRGGGGIGLGLNSLKGKLRLLSGSRKWGWGGLRKAKRVLADGDGTETPLPKDVGLDLDLQAVSGVRQRAP